jgi:hypothetical protein
VGTEQSHVDLDDLASDKGRTAGVRHFKLDAVHTVTKNGILLRMDVKVKGQSPTASDLFHSVANAVAFHTAL